MITCYCPEKIELPEPNPIAPDEPRARFKVVGTMRHGGGGCVREDRQTYLSTVKALSDLEDAEDAKRVVCDCNARSAMLRNPPDYGAADYWARAAKSHATKARRYADKLAKLHAVR